MVQKDSIRVGLENTDDSELISKKLLAGDTVFLVRREKPERERVTLEVFRDSVLSVSQKRRFENDDNVTIVERTNLELIVALNKLFDEPMEMNIKDLIKKQRDDDDDKFLDILLEARER